MVKIDRFVLDINGLNGIYKDLEEIIGIEGVVKLFTYYKGQQVTFPTRMLSKEYVKEQVTNQYNGRNLKLLAKKYGYTERWMREILKNQNIELKKQKEM